MLYFCQAQRLVCTNGYIFWAPSHKSRKGPIRFVMSIRLPDRPLISTGLLLKEMGEIYYSGFTRKAVHKLQIWLISDKNMGTLYEDLRTFILLTAVRYILQLDNSEKANHFCISMATLNY